MPATRRTVFQLVPPQVVVPNQVISMLRDAIPRSELDASGESEFNALLLNGSPDRIAQAWISSKCWTSPCCAAATG